ncbi:Rho guanine nucleotide exchange factor [Lecanora helva]
MAYQQGRQRQMNQYGQYQGLPTLRSQYNTSQPPATHPHVRRTPSFDPGDDGASAESVGDLGDQRRGYRPGSIAGNQDNELYMGPRGPALPPRSTSYGVGGAGGGYQHQDVTTEPRLPPSYNPQQYGAPQVQHSPQPSSATAATFSAAAHQPYVPAAYQSNSNLYQSNYGGSSQGTPPQAYPPTMSPHTSPQPPPPPPRPYESRYGNLISPQFASDSRVNFSNSQPELPYRQQSLSSLPNSQSPPTTSSYTPPAPPPPPFSPTQDAYPSNSPISSLQSFSQRPPTGHNSHQRPSGRPPSLHGALPPLPIPDNGGPRVPSPAIHRRPVGLNSPLPPTPSTPGTPGPTPPAHSPQRSDTNRHPQARPLPGPPSGSASGSDYFNGSNGHNSDQATTPGYDDLMQEVEAAVMGRPLPSARRSPRTARTPLHGSIDENHATEPLFSGRHSGSGISNEYTHTNGNIEQVSEGQYRNYDAFSDPGDLEAEAGLAAMAMADEQDAMDAARRRQSQGSRRGSERSRQEQAGELSSDSDIHIDMDTYGGGVPGGLHYGDQALTMQSEGYAYANDVQDQGEAFAFPRSSQRSDRSGVSESHSGMYDYPIPGEGSIHPFPRAQVDRAGTGGFSEPGAMQRRLSFEDGDEATLAESDNAYSSATQSPSKEDIPEMFFHPKDRPPPQVSPESNRLIPGLMPAGTYRQSERLVQYDQQGRPTFPSAPNDYDVLMTPQGTVIPQKTSSLISHGSSPQTIPPIRSKTDADRVRILRQQQSGLRAGGSVYGDPSLNPSAELLNLPEIPTGKRRKFNPSKLSSNDFKRCSEPWALSSITSWVKEMSEGEADLKEHAIVEGVVALFTHKVPTMNTADAEALGAKVVRSMLDSGTLLKEEEWVKWSGTDMTGVLYQLTGTGCYSPRVHTEALAGRCYSHLCMRTLKKINLQTQVLEPQRRVEDWVTFYSVTKSQIENYDKKEIERQNNLHEIVTTEDTFMDQLNVLRILYRDELSKWQPPIIAPKRKDSFIGDVFGKVDAIKQVNEDYLLAQLKYRQQEQGPWIVGFADIFREWIRKAKAPYIDYAASFPNASSLVRQESERNMLFRQFLDQARDNERSKRLGWDTYLKAPITRLQRYTLLLTVVHKHTIKESEEKVNLAKAIDEIKQVTLECDARVADQTKNVGLAELQAKLQLRPNFADVKLNLTHLGREIIHQGDLQRTGSNKFSWVETHAILFDHYMVLSKVLAARDAAGGLKYEKYDVSKRPIPMDLLVLESASDDPVVKSTMKGIGAVATATKAPNETRASRQSISNQAGPGVLTHTNTASSAASIQTNSSAKTLVTSTVIDNSKDENLLWPFRIKHLGPNKVFTLYSPTSSDRREWCDKIVEAKTRHADSLFKQNAEPFRLRVIADTAFANDPMAGAGKTVVIKGTPLDRAISDVEAQYRDAGPRPGPVCRAAVNCATSFNQPYGNAMVAVGTDYGVYIANANNPRSWTRAIQSNRVTQIAVLEEFSLLIVISDKSLIGYHLDTVCPPAGSGSHHHQNSSTDSSTRRAPQKLSGTRDVGFFATGRMKDRTLVFYKKREGISSTFKVLEPVYQKASTSGTLAAGMRNRFGMKKGSVDFFREFDDFYIPSETYSINLFHSSLAISTARGVEVLTLDKKVPFSIPDLKQPDTASIAQRISGQRPLGMFRLSDSEFLLVFEEVGIYVNKHGDVSRAVVLEFVGKARQACMVGGMFLLLFDAGGGYVEVRNAFNGRLRQVVSGNDVRLLDDGAQQGTAGGGKVKLCMQHPEYERCQVVLELVINEGLKE